MFSKVREWLTPGSQDPGWGNLPRWASAKGLKFKPTVNPRGFVLADPKTHPDGRIEWGPSHRDYLGLYELRMRAGTGADPSVQAVLMPTKQIEEISAPQGLQLLEAGTNVMAPRAVRQPEEVPWLTSLPRATPQALGRLASLYGAASSDLSWLNNWLANDLRDVLVEWSNGPKPGVAPVAMVFVHQQSTLVLRVNMVDPNPEAIEKAVSLFDVALKEARRISGSVRDDDEYRQSAAKGAETPLERLRRMQENNQLAKPLAPGQRPSGSSSKKPSSKR